MANIPAEHSRGFASDNHAGIHPEVLAAIAAADDGADARIRLPYATESNAVFAALPPAVSTRAHARFRFYDWPGEPGLARLMCSFDTEPGDVDALLSAIGG